MMADGVPLQDVVKSFGDVTVIPKLNLDVKEGELVVLAGPSGCGKSSTSRMIAGLERVSNGSIFFRGRAVTWERPKQRDIAMVFQSCALYPHMIVGENMAFALRPAWVSREEVAERVNRAAEMFELTPYLDRKPKDRSDLDAKLRASKRTELALLHKKPVVQ